METDPTWTRSGFEEAVDAAVGGAGGVPPEVVERLWVTLGGQLNTRFEHPRETVRPAAPTSDESVLARLHRAQDTLIFEDDELGRGGMGIVRLATQATVGRKVAVKSLRPSIEAEGAAVALLHEAWITGAVEHPNIVPLYDVSLDARGFPLVVLKRIEGTSWRALLETPAAVRERFGVADEFEWHLRTFMQVCAAAHFAHSRGILHRDLKPDNVMIGAYGEVYLVDWGIARAFRDEGDGRLPRADAQEGMAGTPAYMAPEMFGGAPVTPRSDVYLLGATLYHVLAGRPPHQGDTILGLMLEVLRGPETPPGPASLVAICQRAMASEPDARHADADALRLDVQRYLEQRHATRLAEDADERLSTLAAGLAEGTLDVAARQRLFGECRFGFARALASWPGSALAADGLRRTTMLMVEQSLADDQPDAAAALLAELTPPDDALAARVAEAQARAREQQARLRRLELIQAEYDPRQGGRARLALFTALVGVLMLGPARRLGGADTGPFSHWLWPAGLFAVVLATIVLGRRHLMRNALNRRVYGMLLTVLVLYGGLVVGMDRMALPLEQRSTVGLHFGAAVMALFAIVADLRSLVPAATYFLGFLAAAAGLLNPDVGLLVGHGVLGASIIWLGLRPPPSSAFLQLEHPAMKRRLDRAEADATRPPAAP